MFPFDYFKKKKQEKSQKDFVRLFLTGMAMGAADIVPGVSGGTIAFILGIYEELIYAIKVSSGEALKLIFKGKIKEAIKVVPFSFLIPLGLGLLTALLTMAGLISTLLESQPVYIWSFFFGLVVASVMIVSKRIVTWDLRDVIALVVGTVGAYALVGAVPVATPTHPIAYFLAGAIAIIAMILPGISGSFLLLIMGKYSQILEAVVERDFLILALVGSGCVVGLALFSRVLSWLFAKHHDVIIALLTGFMIGSLRKVWPWKEITSTYIDSHGEELALTTKNIVPQALDQTVIIAIVLAIIAASLIIYLDKISLTKETTEDIDNKKFTKEHDKSLKSQKH